MTTPKEDLFKTYDLGCALLISTLTGMEHTPRNMVLRNFAAKSISQLRSVRMLYQLRQTADGYIILRSMLDRLAHLYYLERTNTFTRFEEWSFMKQIEANNNALSDAEMKDRLDKSLFVTSEANKKRYKSLRERGVKWDRPNVETEFRKKGLYPLYKFGYDHGSSHVHPMANDGMIEHDAMLRNPTENISRSVDYQTEIVIKNAVLVSSLTIRDCIYSSGLKWTPIAYDFLEDFPKAFAGDPSQFRENFGKMEYMIRHGIPLGQ